MSPIPAVILASTSPRRAEILRNAGLEFTVRAPEIDESLRPGEDAEAYVRRLAVAKARAVANRSQATPDNLSSVIVAADTVVTIDGDILGKPASFEDARAMLRRLSGRWHDVFSGLAVLAANRRNEVVEVERTCVEFSVLSEREIEEYIETGEPFDKAGGYAIQGCGGKFIPRVRGCYFNVMGLPLARLYTILQGFASEK